MKKLNKLSVLALTSLFILSSCETTELDLTSNPNALSPENASVELFINNVQEDFAYFVNSLGDTGARLTRIAQLSGDRMYQDAYSPGSFSGIWSSAYQGMMEDIRVMNTIASEQGLTYHIGMGQVIQAYILLTLVDYFGDVPYTEALLGSENLNPAADSGQSVYNSALSLLDQAISNFSGGGPAPQYDMYYGGNAAGWIKAANSIKKRAYLNMGDTGSYSAITNYITTNADDFQFQWGTNAINPDVQNFRDFSNYLKKMNKKNPVAMFCTGGIRCEKASVYLKQKGFKNVYQLKGGILNYLKTISKKDSLWKGECYVFDNRVSVKHKLKQGTYSMCSGCRTPVSPANKKSYKYEEGVSCPNCHDKLTNSQKDRFRMRQKQINLAKKAGKKHIFQKEF